MTNKNELDIAAALAAFSQIAERARPPVSAEQLAEDSKLVDQVLEVNPLADDPPQNSYQAKVKNIVEVSRAGYPLSDGQKNVLTNILTKDKMCKQLFLATAQKFLKHEFKSVNTRTTIESILAWYSTKRFLSVKQCGVLKKFIEDQ